MLSLASVLRLLQLGDAVFQPHQSVVHLLDEVHKRVNQLHRLALFYALLAVLAQPGHVQPSPTRF